MPAFDRLCGRHEDDTGFGNVAGQLLMRRHDPDVDEAQDFERARDHGSQVHLELVVRGDHPPERGDGDLFPLPVFGKTLRAGWRRTLLSPPSTL